MDLDVKEQTVGGTRHAGTVPRVSIIIPSYNHERFVGRAIESALSQTYQDFEIVITDDASTDGSVDVLSTYARQDPRIKLFLNRFNYETHAINHCIQHSSGEYIAMLSSDDEFFPTKLERQVDFLDRHPEVAAVFTQARIVDEQSRDFPESSHFYCTIFQQPNRSRHEWLRHFFFDGNCLCHPSVLIRRSVYDTLGLYNPLMGALDDLDMWVRICLHHEIHVLADTLVNFRVRDGHANVSADTPENFRRGQFEMIKILDHFVSPDALAQIHLIFPEFADQLAHAPDAVKRHVLAMAALEDRSAFTPLLGDRSALSTLVESGHETAIEPSDRRGARRRFRQNEWRPQSTFDRAPCSSPGVLARRGRLLRGKQPLQILSTIGMERTEISSACLGYGSAVAVRSVRLHRRCQDLRVEDRVTDRRPLCVDLRSRLEGGDESCWEARRFGCRTRPSVSILSTGNDPQMLSEGNPATAGSALRAAGLDQARPGTGECRKRDRDAERHRREARR